MPPPRTFIDNLRAVTLFRGFDDAAVALVAAAAQERTYQAGRTLFLRGEEADSMFVVLSGKIRLSVSTADGRELALRHLSAGEVFGEIALLDGGERTANAVALLPSTLLSISRGRFQSILDHTPGMEKALIRGLCLRLRDTTDQLESIALLPLDQRLSRLLLQLSKAAARSEEALDISQSEMAMLVGASRPKVNQLLVAWRRAGVATRTSRGLILDRAKLKDLVDSPDES